MKKIIPLLLAAALCLCAACGKNVSTKTDLTEKEWKEIYSYETPFGFSEERVGKEVQYINGMEELVDEAVEMIRQRMQNGHSTGEWGGEVWTSGSMEDTAAAFDGKGYYICTHPITTYDNNRNIIMDSFTLLIFSEDLSVAGDAAFKNFNNEALADKKGMEIDLMPVSLYINELKAMPDMEFISIHAYYLRGDYNMNPDLFGGIDHQAEASGMLGEDNKVYAYDGYSGALKEKNKLNLYGGNSFTVEGDLFHALPEEMRCSYGKLMENLIWVEYQE